MGRAASGSGYPRLKGDDVWRVGRCSKQVPATPPSILAKYVDQQIISGFEPCHQCRRQLLASGRHTCVTRLLDTSVKPEINREWPVQTLVPLWHVDQQVTLIKPSVGAPD